jgi:hypothetical protein
MSATPYPTLARGGALVAPTRKPSPSTPLHALQLLLERRVNPRVVVGSVRRVEGTLVPVAPHACLGHGTWARVIIMGIAGDKNA